MLRVMSSDGAGIAVYEAGDRANPTIVAVHGYPDNHTLWDGVVRHLADRFHVVTYDVRGAGESEVPAHRDGYRIERLLDDLVAVMDAAAPGEPVHLVGHDWGSVIAWEAACRVAIDDRLRDRVASLTSVSGPCFGHVGAFYRAARRASWRSRDGRQLKRDAAAQAARSWYVYAFHVPRLSDAVVRARTTRLASRSDGPGRHFGPTLPADAVNGLNLYRANVRRYAPIPGGPRTDVPVLVVVPTRDRYVTPAMTSQVSRYVPNLERVEVSAGHWVMWSDPDELADLIKRHVAQSAPQGPHAADVAT
jgi:pimeloyl-ACP methyl ester carboxylesterase